MKPSHACWYLNNKTWFYAPAVDPRDEPTELSTPYWCLRTHDAIGPDGIEATMDCCGPDRPCYKPELEL